MRTTLILSLFVAAALTSATASGQSASVTGNCNVLVMNSHNVQVHNNCDEDKELRSTVTYYELTGLVASLFLNDLVDPELDEIIGRSRIVIKNNVFRFGRDFLEKYGVDLALAPRIVPSINGSIRDQDAAKEELLTSERARRVSALRRTPKVFFNEFGTPMQYEIALPIEDWFDDPSSFVQQLNHLRFLPGDPEPLGSLVFGAIHVIDRGYVGHRLTEDFVNKNSGVSAFPIFPYRDAVRSDLAGYNARMRELWVKGSVSTGVGPTVADDNGPKAIEEAIVAYARERGLPLQSVVDDFRNGRDPATKDIIARLDEIAIPKRRRAAIDFDFEADPSYRAIEYLTRVDFPSDFMLVQYENSAHGDFLRGPRPVAFVRDIQLTVMVLENVSRRTHQISSFSGRSSGSDVLRSPELTDKLLAREQSNQLTGPPITLAPGARLVIPMRVQFVDKFREPNRGTATVRETPPPQLVSLVESGRAVAAILVKSGDTELVEYRALAPLGRNFLAQIRPRSPVRVFDFGPSVAIDSMMVDGKHHPLRQFNPNQLVLYGSILGGSCPFLLTTVGEGNVWVSHGEILTKAVGASAVATEVVKVRDFAGGLRLIERQDEVTFIKGVSVVAVHQDGSRTELSGMIENSPFELSGLGGFLRLSRGQTLSMWFDTGAVRDVESFEISVSGYYLPL